MAGQQARTRSTLLAARTRGQRVGRDHRTSALAVPSAPSGYEVEVYKNGQGTTNLVCIGDRRAARLRPVACAKPLEPRRVPASTTSTAGGSVASTPGPGATRGPLTQLFDVSARTDAHLLSGARRRTQAPNRASPVVAAGARARKQYQRRDAQRRPPARTSPRCTTTATGVRAHRRRHAAPTPGRSRHSTPPAAPSAPRVEPSPSTPALTAHPAAISAPDGSAVGQTLTGTPPDMEPVRRHQHLPVAPQRHGHRRRHGVDVHADRRRLGKEISLRVTGRSPASRTRRRSATRSTVTAGGALQATVAAGDHRHRRPRAVAAGHDRHLVAAVADLPLPVAAHRRPDPGCHLREPTSSRPRTPALTSRSSCAPPRRASPTAPRPAPRSSVATLASTTTATLKADRVKARQEGQARRHADGVRARRPRRDHPGPGQGQEDRAFTMAPVHKGKKTLKLPQAQEGQAQAPGRLHRQRPRPSARSRRRSRSTSSSERAGQVTAGIVSRRDLAR